MHRISLNTDRIRYNNNFVTNADQSAEGVNVSNYQTSIEESNKEGDNLGSPLKF